jgi:hypothetical protein
VRLLDLFCGAGGASVGYHRAGFEIVGVDNQPQPDYPFTFVQTDAMEYVAEHGQNFQAIHASPPCQAYTVLNFEAKASYPDLVPQVRHLLRQTGRLGVIENVPGATMRSDLVLCGGQFGLRVRRHRLFECVGWTPTYVDHPTCVRGPVPVYGNGGGKGTVKLWQEAMGMDWTESRRSLAQAIPPAYTELIGRQLIERLTPRKYPVPTLSRPGDGQRGMRGSTTAQR